MRQALLSNVQALHAEVESVMVGTTKQRLAQCARLLATYVALYKHQFGELSSEQYNALSEELSENLEFGESVYSSGLRELLETLALVELGSRVDPSDPDMGADRTLN